MIYGFDTDPDERCDTDEQRWRMLAEDADFNAIDELVDESTEDLPERGLVPHPPTHA